VMCMCLQLYCCLVVLFSCVCVLFMFVCVFVCLCVVLVQVLVCVCGVLLLMRERECIHACMCVCIAQQPLSIHLAPRARRRHRRAPHLGAAGEPGWQGSLPPLLCSVALCLPNFSALLKPSRTFIHPHVYVRAHGHGSELPLARHLIAPHGSLCAIATSLRRGESPPPPARLLVR